MYSRGASEVVLGRLIRKLLARERHDWTHFVSMQNLYNLLYREEEREMLPQCIDQGVAVIPYSPLARGLLARRRDGAPTTRAGSDPIQAQSYGSPGDADVVDAVISLSSERGVPPAQIALAWLLHRPGVTAPIVALLDAPYLPHPVT
jgi:aryl-alcohol dehydrogenase-like predicted oxidoreductase